MESTEDHGANLAAMSVAVVHAAFGRPRKARATLIEPTTILFTADCHMLSKLFP